MQKRFSPLTPKEYTRVLRAMPIVCVDLVVMFRGKFLLVRRVNRPARDKWWFPGGRIMKFETIVQAAKRKLMEETGIRGGFYGSPITAQEAIFPDSAFGIPAHTISVIVPVRLTRNPKRIVLDAQSSEAQWFSRIHSAWPAYIKRALRLAGFR